MNFDRLAPHYDWLEDLTAGSRLQRARTRWLGALAGCQNVLSMGEGHGRFAAAFLARYPGARLTCVEASPGMIEVARQRTCAWADRVRWVTAEALAWRPTEKYDAIVTCFFLDCFTPDTLAAAVKHLANCAEEQARWLVADFTLPAAGPARWRAQAVHALMYRFFRVTAGHPARYLTRPDGLLAAHGFRLLRRQEFDWGLVHSDVWQRGDVDRSRLPF
jgi:ubiquinone/menaquinone biosynthesis C-methylase UbiE